VLHVRKLLQIRTSVLPTLPTLLGTYLLHHHEFVDSCGEWVAHPVYVIPSQINQHDL
jgi:hypothetical protein